VQREVRIPMHHGVDSLNLGHALAIAMAAVSRPG
jgi:tRNA G18 (ribose-2'-O)-methylase SpoU